MVSQMFDTLADVVAKTGASVTKAVWQSLGWPSEQAWRDAGSPSTRYAAPVFGSPLKPAATYKPETPATSEGSGLVVPAPEDVRLSSEDPFTSGLNANLFGQAKEDLGGLAVRQQLADERANTMTGMEQVETLMNPFAQGGAGGFEMTQPTYGSRSQGTLRGEGLQSGAISGDYSSVARGLQDPEALALLGGGLFLPELAALAGAGPTAAAGFAAPRVSQETLGLENMPGVELGNMARENLPGLLGTGVGGALEFALDPMTLGGAGLSGTRALPNLLGKGTLSPAQYFSSAALGGAGSAVGGEVAGTPGAVAGGLLGGVAGMTAPTVAPLVGRAALSGLESAGDALQTGTRWAGGVPGYGAGLTPGADDDLSALLAQSLNIGRTQGRDALVKQGAEAAQDVAASMRATSREGAQPFIDTAHLRRRATDLSTRLDDMKQSITERLGPGEAGAIRMPGRSFDRLRQSAQDKAQTALGRPLLPDEADYIANLSRERLEQFAKDVPAPQTGQMAFTGQDWKTPGKSALATVAENIASVPGALKYVQTSGDMFGFQFRQGAPAAFIDPKAWGRNFERIGKAYLEDPQSNAAMLRLQEEPRFATGDLLNITDATTNSPIVIKPLAEVMGGDFKTPGMELINDSLVMRLAQSVPLAKRSENGMRVGYLGLANDLRNSMIDDAVRAGIRDQSWYDHFNDIAAVAVGYGNVPDKLKGLSNGFYSLRNIAARFQMMTKPFTEPGPLLDVRLPGSARAGRGGGVFATSPRGVAARNLTRFAAGELAGLRLLSFAGRNSGLFEVGWNPLEPGFGKLDIVDDDGNTFSTDLVGGWGSYIRAIAKTAAAASGDARYDKDDAIAEWVKFWRYKAGPMPSIVLDTLLNVTGADEVRAFDSPFAAPLPIPGVNASEAKEKWGPAQLASTFMPFFAGEVSAPVLEGTLDVTKPSDLLKVGGLLAAASTASVTGLYEPSVFSLAPEMFDGREFDSLSGAERAQVNKRVVEQGGELEDWQRAGPYGRADDDAFADIKARYPETLGQYEDLNALRDELESQIIADAVAKGQELTSQEVDAKRRRFEDTLGITELAEVYQAQVVLTDPEIIDAMQRQYDARERTFAPSKKMRALAEWAKAHPDQAQQMLAAPVTATP